MEAKTSDMLTHAQPTSRQTSASMLRPCPLQDKDEAWKQTFHDKRATTMTSTNTSTRTKTTTTATTQRQDEDDDDDDDDDYQ